MATHATPPVGGTRDSETPLAGTVTVADIREGVRTVFNAVARTPTEPFRFAVGPSLARAVGYPDDVLASLPSLAAESFTGLAYLHPYLTLHPGEAVLDLGSGTGLDALIAAPAVGSRGAVTGLDFAEAMVVKATALAEARRTTNVSFVQGSAEAMPFPDRRFDAILVNGLLNLCPEKARVVREIARVLKPEGRAVVAEISFTEPLPAVEIRTLTDWFR